MCVFVHLSAPTPAYVSKLTFVVGRVINAEISVPDDCQLHGKTAHLHPIIEIL